MAWLPAWRADRSKAIVGGAFLIVYAVLLFSRLGHYGFWSDEATTALFADSVWHTGDTSAVLGDNVVAYRNGIELEGLKNRFIPPLPYFLAAPFIGVFGRSTLAGRFVFALLGFATAVLIVWWLAKDRARLPTWILVAIGVTGNISLVLYSRQCRYYAAGIFFSTAIAYLFVHWDGRRRSLLMLCGCAFALLATHYLAYAALIAALAADYVIFRRSPRLSMRHLGIFIASQLVLGGIVLSIWTPFGHVAPARSTSWLADVSTIFAWNIRDANANEFGVGLVIAAAPIAFVLTGRRDWWLLRLPFGLLVYDAVVSVLSPQPVDVTTVADVRYLAAIIPACIVLSVRTIEATGLKPFITYALALLAFYTNVLNAPMSRALGAWVAPQTSTPLAYAGELWSPPTNPSRAAAEWVNANVPSRSTLYALPEYEMYALMFSAPQVTYAWQFDGASRTKYPALPDIHFKFLQLPDYVLAFGPQVDAVRGMVEQAAAQLHVRYVERGALPINGSDMTRPELFWRSFTQPPIVDPAHDAIYIFEKQKR